MTAFGVAVLLAPANLDTLTSISYESSVQHTMAMHSGMLQATATAFPRQVRCIRRHICYNDGLQPLFIMQAKLGKETQALQAKMEMAVYRERTPGTIKAEDSSKLAKLQAQQQTLQQALKSIEDMQQS